MVREREMEVSSSSDPNKDATESDQQPTKPKGGFITMPFIIANEAFEKVASYGLLPNMILYLIKDYHFSVATGTTILSLWSAITNFTPLLGAFFSDSYFGRFKTIAFGSISSLLGTILLWLTTMIPQAKPPHCNPTSKDCQSATTGQITLLFSSFVLMSIGAGGIRPCSMAFGADQFLQRGGSSSSHQKNDRVLQSFFNWYYASTAASVLVALSVIVYIQDHLGWRTGFGIPAIIMFLSAVLFFLASSLYIKMKPNKSLFLGFAQVSVAAYKNKRFSLPSENGNGCYYHKDSELAVPTDKLRFLNKACLITNAEKDLNPDGSASNPWRLCTVSQVEELKALIKVMPIWSTGIMLAVNMSQHSFPLLQANSMDRHVTRNFQIPGGSFSMFTIITLTIWVAIYDRLVLPLLAKLTGRPYGLSLKERMGIGLILSIMATSTGATVESIRRRTAIREGFAEDPHAVLKMSAMWLVPQHCLGGLAEAFNAVGQNEFFYSEMPKSMSSIATSLFGLGMAVGNLLVGVIVNIVDDASKHGGKESWVSSNLNKGHYDYYYWVLAILGGFNFLYFLLCCWAYGPTEEEKRSKVVNDDEDDDDKASGPTEEESLMKVEDDVDDDHEKAYGPNIEAKKVMVEDDDDKGGYKKEEEEMSKQQQLSKVVEMVA